VHEVEAQLQAAGRAPLGAEFDEQAAGSSRHGFGRELLEKPYLFNSAPRRGSNS
jgi:hypothetical protein